jgi:UDP:flavonoid glycosyltransferase YjiC (YdhE family)
MRLLLGAFGDPGHAFPMLALGSRLVQRGHDVTLQTWVKWREHVEAAGMRFAAAPEYQVFPTRDRPLKPYEAAVRAARETLPLVEEIGAEAVVADILTIAVALAGEMAGVPVATLVPHVYPVHGGDGANREGAGGGTAGFPPYALGARLPRTPLGRWLWRSLSGPVGAGERQGRDELNETRRRLGLPALDRVHGGISSRLCLVGTFPQLEYPREWPAHVHVVGPMIWEPPSEEVEPPPGEGPLVVVAPSTAQDPGQRLLTTTLEGLAGAPVRVLATWNRRPPPHPLPSPSNARVVEWISYARTFPRAELVVSHAGHGTLARALASGAPVVAVPAAGDMGENAARADWAGAGVRLPMRLLSPTTIRLAVDRALANPAHRSRAQQLAAWYDTHDPQAHAAELIESLG